MLNSKKQKNLTRTNKKTQKKDIKSWNNFLILDLLANHNGLRGILMQRINWSQENGQSLIEFTSSLMILLLVTFGMFEAARIVYTASVLQAAAQEGARAGMVNASNVISAVKSRLVGVDEDVVVVNITYPTASQIAVEVTYAYQMVTPLVGTLISSDGSLDLSGSASMLIR
jgi:hypothetical protein